MPASNTYESISSVTLTSATSSVTFGSIPQTYTDLVLVINAGIVSSGNSIYIQFNSDTTSNYSSTDLWGNGTTASSGRTSSTTLIRVLGRGIGADNTLIDNSITHIMNYANTTTNKTILNRSNVSGGTSLTAGLWRSTSAINSFTLTGETTNILSGSTFSLYGIKAA